MDLFCVICKSSIVSPQRSSTSTLCQLTRLLVDGLDGAIHSSKKYTLGPRPHRSTYHLVHYGMQTNLSLNKPHPQKLADSYLDPIYFHEQIFSTPSTQTLSQTAQTLGCPPQYRGRHALHPLPRFEMAPSPPVGIGWKQTSLRSLPDDQIQGGAGGASRPDTRLGQTSFETFEAAINLCVHPPMQRRPRPEGQGVRYIGRTLVVDDFDLSSPLLSIKFQTLTTITPLLFVPHSPIYAMSSVQGLFAAPLLLGKSLAVSSVTGILTRYSGFITPLGELCFEPHRCV